MSDDYAREPGLKVLLNNLRKSDDEEFHVITERRTKEMEYRADVIRGFHAATADYIDQLRAVEEALQAKNDWERHAIGLLVATAEPIREAEVKMIDHDRVAKLAQEIEAERHPFLKRIA